MIPQLLPADTTAEALRAQLNILRRLSPSRRPELACRMTDSLREFVASGVRRRHPEYDERQVKLATIRLMLGDALYREVFSDEDVAV
jgi:hypothetical protein